MATELGENEIAEEIDGWVEKAHKAFDTLYDAEAGMYKSKDQLTGKLLAAKTSAGFLPLFARVASAEQAAALAATLERWLDCVKSGIPSYDPEAANFEPLRYWRGPVWAIINWMITDGLRAYGYEHLACRVEADTYELLVSHGISEYYNPVTGAAAGGKLFSWTAAMCLAWLSKAATPAC